MQDIERRYLKTHRNFWEIYRPLSEDWAVYVNGKSGHRMIACGNPKEYHDHVVESANWEVVKWKFQD